MKMYEGIRDGKLIPRTPVIIRIDGKAFHTFTNGMDRPWDEKFNDAMHQTALALCNKIQGAKFAFVQSDEISILLTDYENFDTERWFDYRIQKLTSVSASIATAVFNDLIQPYRKEKGLFDNLAFFDARAFNMDMNEVTNYFIWRQQDATKNSIQLLGREYFSSKELHKLNGNDIQNKLLTEKDVNWNDIDIWKRRGTCIYKDTFGGAVSPLWVVDKECPIFTENRDFIEVYL